MGPQTPHPRINKDQRRLAILYDAHHSRHLEDLEFWKDIATQRGSPILELGCGTGRVLITLARAGHTVFGVDRNPAMLRVLKERLNPIISSMVHIVLSDLTAYRLAERFSLILLPCNTYSTLTRVERRKSLLLVHRHLAPEGLFALSIPNPVMLSEVPIRSDPEVEEVFQDPESGDPVQVSSEWERSGKHFVLHWHYDRLFPEGQVERISIQTRQEINDSRVYLKELEDSGLKPIRVCGDFDLSAYDMNSPNLILIAER